MRSHGSGYLCGAYSRISEGPPRRWEWSHKNGRVRSLYSLLRCPLKRVGFFFLELMEYRPTKVFSLDSNPNSLRTWRRLPTDRSLTGAILHSPPRLRTVIHLLSSVTCSAAGPSIPEGRKMPSEIRSGYFPSVKELIRLLCMHGGGDTLQQAPPFNGPVPFSAASLTWWAPPSNFLEEPIPSS